MHNSQNYSQKEAFRMIPRINWLKGKDTYCLTSVFS